ncbi:MAG: hypothetical protein GXP40_00940 [Chloroflexi bacterium]|nr:hypothetical protein [Chloroflexota bacterium]
MTTQSPVEQLRSDINALQSSLRELQNAVRLSSIRDNVEDLQTTVNGMDQRIAALRERGYAFEKELENQAADFAQQWAALAPGITRQIETQAAKLEASLRPLETQITQLATQAGSPAALRPVADKLKAQVKTLQDKVEAVEQTIEGSYDQFGRQVRQVVSHLEKIDWMLTQLAEATFQLLPTEAGIAAVKAVWAKDGEEKKDDPEGVLYLTDQRLIFEQKEKVATKKVLFIATEKKLVQEMLWEAPVALIEETKASKQGFMKKDDFIEVRFASGAPYDTVHVHIWQRGDEWKALLKRAKAKEFDGTRAIAIDEAEVEKVKSAPTQCPACGGVIDQVILRGQDTVTCEYCGNVFRL